MPARGGRTPGPSRIPVNTPSNPGRELRSATREENGVLKRRRLEIESSEADSTGSDDDEYLDHSDKSATSLSELATLVTALKEIIEKQTKIIENVQAEQLSLKGQNAELQEQVGHLRSQISAFSVSPP
jgi:hypothetical protein